MLSVQLHAPSEDVLLLTYATDLSDCGVFVRANRPLPLGTRVKLQLQQTRGERIVVAAEVVRVPPEGPRGMGLSFVDTDEGIREGIGRLIGRCGAEKLVTTADAEAFVWHQRGSFA